jgi:hypothetical protein
VAQDDREVLAAVRDEWKGMTGVERERREQWIISRRKYALKNRRV